MLFEIEANSLARLFAQATRGLCNALTRADDVMARESRVVELEAPDPQQLLLGWLRELLVVFETEGVLFSCAKVEVDNSNAGGLSLKGHLWGEPYDPGRHRIERSLAPLEAGAVELSRHGELWHSRLVA